MSKLTLLIDSDFHFDKDGIRPDKVDNVTRINNQRIIEPIDVLICAGDLTKHGTGNNCCKHTDELGLFLNQYFDMIDPKIKKYLCLGNHDTYTSKLYQPVKDYIRMNYGDLRYNFKIKGYTFICLNIYPDDKSLKYLRNILIEIEDQPVILFWHYNLTGKWSDWWSEPQKEKLYLLLQEMKANVKLIITGHIHINYFGKWKEYKNVIGSGPGLIKCVLENDEVTFSEV